MHTSAEVSEQIATPVIERLRALDDYSPVRSVAVGELGTMHALAAQSGAQFVHQEVVMPGAPASALVQGFRPAGSAVPHLALDVIAMPDGEWGVFCDLLPRVDLAANLAWSDVVYAGFDEVLDALAGDNIRTKPLTRRHLSLLSPWVLGVFVTGDLAVQQAATAVEAYVDRFVELVANPDQLSALVEMSPEELAARDTTHRHTLVDPTIDPVWEMVEQMLGADVASDLRGILAGDPSCWQPR